jgi:hypothetical protein
MESALVLALTVLLAAAVDGGAGLADVKAGGTERLGHRGATLVPRYSKGWRLLCEK